MPRVSKETLQGYMLEEVLAYLIRNSGYNLLVDPKQDPRELDIERNGLVVKGRGAVHQVDVLGQLEWIPAFTFPIRLFVEAKFREGATGLGTVRNAVGTLLDINQNSSPMRDGNSIVPRYQYVYALFSTSGFSKQAQDMALAHQVSLIDLGADEYKSLRDAISDSASSIWSDWQRDGSQNTINRLRYELRSRLGTQPEAVAPDERLLGSERSFETLLDRVVGTAKEYGELFVAMVNGPYLVLLQPKNPRRFLNYCIEHPTHGVEIHWTDSNGAWYISPSDNNSAYDLSFSLPHRLRDWIFNSSDARQRALFVKQQIFSDITVYYRNARQDYLFRLRFDLEATLRHSL